MTKRSVAGPFGVTLILLLALGDRGAAEAPPARTTRTTVFPAGVELVNVNISVLNGRDRFVTDLAQQDFIVLENGIRQQASLFAQKDLPISVVLLLDMSESMKPRIGAVRDAAARLIESLRPEDRAEIITFNSRPKVLQSFTSDHQKLNEAIANTEAGGGTALHNTLYITLKEVAALGKTEEMRRRAVVLLSDGEDTISMITDDQVLEAARACEVGIYSILIGLSSDPSSSRDQARYLLNALARESGGQAFFPNDNSDLGRLYARIAQELHSQYNIGYVSSNPSLDGAWRQILVLTPQRDGLQVRHRLGYYAVPAGPLPKAKVGDVRASAGRFTAVVAVAPAVP